MMTEMTTLRALSARQLVEADAQEGYCWRVENGTGSCLTLHQPSTDMVCEHCRAAKLLRELDAALDALIVPEAPTVKLTGAFGCEPGAIGFGAVPDGSADDPRLAAIRAREQAATKGPWEPERCEFNGGQISYDINSWHKSARAISTKVSCGCERRHDADFIAHARQDIPWLLTEVARLQAERDEAQRYFEQAEESRATNARLLDELYPRLAAAEAVRDEAQRSPTRSEIGGTDIILTKGIWQVRVDVHGHITFPRYLGDTE